MFGCLRQIGCLVVVALLAVAAWFLRDEWWPRVFGERASAVVAYEPASPAGAAEAREAIRSLGAPSGPAFVNLTPEQLGAFVVEAAAKALPASLDSVQAAVQGDHIHLRASMQLDEIRGLDVLGPFTDFVGRRERIELAGTLDILQPGLAQYRVDRAQVGDFPIPGPAIPRLLRRLSRDARPAGVADNGIAFPVPREIGDVRVARGRVTLYKGVP